MLVRAVARSRLAQSRSLILGATLAVRPRARGRDTRGARHTTALSSYSTGELFPHSGAMPDATHHGTTVAQPACQLYTSAAPPPLLKYGYSEIVGADAAVGRRRGAGRRYSGGARLSLASHDACRYRNSIACSHPGVVSPAEGTPAGGLATLAGGLRWCGAPKRLPGSGREPIRGKE